MEIIQVSNMPRNQKTDLRRFSALKADSGRNGREWQEGEKAEKSKFMNMSIYM